MKIPFRYYNSSPEVIRLAVMMYIRYPLSLRQVEDLLFERGIDICHETVRFWWNRFGPMFAAEIRKRRIHHRSFSQWRWHLDEVFVRINGETHYLWRAGDHEGEVLEVFAGVAPGSQSRPQFSKAHDETLRPAEIVRDRSTSLIRCGDEGHWGCGSSGMRTMAQQSGRELTPAVPSKGRSDGQIQGHKAPPEIRRRSRLGPQPLQSGASSN